MNLPSLELLNKLYNQKVIKAEFISITHIGITQNKQYVKIYFEMYFKIVHIHELAYVCKEYIVKDGGMVHSKIIKSKYKDQNTIYQVYVQLSEGGMLFYGNSESEALFNAGEQIIKDKK